MSILRRTVVLLIVVLIPLVAAAQNNRSAVAITGSDAATCTVPDPCRTFGVALSKTNAGGEVIVLSSGGYGPFTVSQSVTIVSPSGIYAAIAPTSGTGIVISTASGASVVLRGLYVNGALGGSVGVWVLSAGTITYLENMVIAGFSLGGAVGVYETAAADFRIKDSFVRNNYYGIAFSGASASSRARATIDHCRVEGNTYAISPATFTDTTVSESLMTGNFRGLSIDSGGTDIDARVAVNDSVFAQNSVGIFAIRTLALVRVAGSTITQNTQFALDIQQGAQVTSAGNNVVIDNAAKETFSGTFALQ